MHRAQRRLISSTYLCLRTTPSEPPRCLQEPGSRATCSLRSTLCQSCVLLRCAQGGDHAPHHTDRHPGRVDHWRLSDRQSKRPRPAPAAFSCPERELMLAAHVPVNSCTAPRRHGRVTHQPDEVPYGGFGPEGSELPTGQNASLFKVKHCGRWFPCDTCAAHPHTELRR